MLQPIHKMNLMLDEIFLLAFSNEYTPKSQLIYKVQDRVSAEYMHLSLLIDSLVKSNLIHKNSNQQFKITEEGKNVLKENFNFLFNEVNELYKTINY